MSVTRAVAYVRFSSDGQREESIEAQVRAITEYTERNSYALKKVYADRGISGTTDNRAEFQRMIDDAKNKKFDAVIVHKLDRFARNRADSAIYRRELSKYGVRLISVLENFDDSPESVILQSVIEGYNEYYSKNLRREVMKGLKENALTCRFTGGIPCLGYDIDKNTLKYVINNFEAEAVKLIFKMYLEGAGYTAIINELNKKGFKTKNGNLFGKNSLYDILRNEKYCGIYIYNKSTAVDNDGKFNRHTSKPDDQIIRIEGGIPQIISKEDFAKVQEKMRERKHKTAQFKAKQEYLLSGKIVCGTCGAAYAGNARKTGDKLYISYTCTKNNRKNDCHNSGIQRDYIENVVLSNLSENVFNTSILPEIMKNYNNYALERNKGYSLLNDELKLKLSETQRQIKNIVNYVATTGSCAMLEKLTSLEQEQTCLEKAIAENEAKKEEMKIDAKQIKLAFNKAKRMLKNGTLKNKKAIVQQFVKRVIVYKDKITIECNIAGDYSVREDIIR